MEPAEARSGSFGISGAAVTHLPQEAGKCPGCHTPTEVGWRACPECGAELRTTSPRVTPPVTASALPSMDTGEVEFVPILGGARRPITFVEVGPSPSRGPTVSLTSLTVHGSPSDGTPQSPVTEAPRRPVTVAPVEEVVAPLELPEKAPEAVREATRETNVEPTATTTTLTPTVLFLSQKAPQDRRLDRADMEEIERMIGEAVDRAVRHSLALHIPSQSALAGHSTHLSLRKRVAGVGAGLLVGGALANLLVLNWDVWVRGELSSAIGWVQQTGIIGMAAMAGAGAMALILAAPRGKRRAVRAR